MPIPIFYSFKRLPLPQQQQGMVLILAMMVVALVTSLVVATSWQFELSMSRNENRWHGIQARMVLEGGEKLIGKLVLIPDLDDPSDDGNADHLQEIWMAPISREIDGGFISVNISDAQARFNINLLALQKVPSPDPAVVALCNRDPELYECKYSVSQRRFIRFLQVIPLNEAPLTTDQAKEITDALIDWLDVDSIPNGYGGAEQDYYSGLEVPIVVSNGPMTSISELSLVKGFTPELYEKLLPYVIALPANGPNEALLNINTMPDLMLRMFNAAALDLPADEEEAIELIRLRNEKLDVALVGPGAPLGFQDVQNFIDTVVVGTISGVVNATDFDGTELVVATKYFIYSGEVVIGDKTRRGKSLLFRDAAQRKVITLWRTDANF